MAAYERHDGYIMGATGQDPKKWAETSWWFSQYDNDPRAKAQALYWREHAERVWDCNGLAEGLYKDATGASINTKARYNYSQWCDPKGGDMIPAEYRVPGAAVFWGSSAGNITHVAYLVEPVDAGDPSGDWYLIEARGVMYGVVRTKLLSRKPQFWGLMTKYFDYGEDAADIAPALRKGSTGEAVKVMQEKLLAMGYDLGKWGADGDFGSATEAAVKEFQINHGLPMTGIANDATLSALDDAMDGDVYTVTIRNLTRAQTVTLINAYPGCEVVKA